jgi:benzoate membrane transport protein
LGLFRLSEADPVLVGALVLTFIVARQRLPRYALLLVLTVGVSITTFRGDGVSLASHITWGKLVPVLPVFEPTALFSLAIPLFLVTLVSQNLPGLVVLRTAGYQPQPRTLLVGTSLASLLMAPFGAHSVNLAAITAALCTSDEAHPDRNRRWTVGMLYALFYLVLAALSPVLVRLFLALSKAAIAALTGVALIPALTSAMDSMLAAKDQRDAAILTFLTTGSGVAIFGLGSAFWGLLVGFAALGASALLRRTKTQS